MSQIISLESKQEECEGCGCHDKATEEITVEAGDCGPITLFVCGNCRNKFVDT